MNKSTKIIIALEVVATLFLVAATVIGIIKCHWLFVGSHIVWIGIVAMLIILTVRNDKVFREKEALRAENFDLRRENNCLRSANRYLEERRKKQESGEKTILWFQERFVELTLQMEQHHGVAKEIRISPNYLTKKVEIDF